MIYECINYCNSLRGVIFEYEIYDSELKVMEVLWKEDDSAKHIISENAEIGWNKILLIRLLKNVLQGAIERYGSNHMQTIDFQREC